MREEPSTTIQVPETRNGSGRARDPDFHRLLETIPSAAYVCDASGLITYFNHRASDLWGRDPKLNDDADRFCGSFKLFTVEGTPIRHDQCWMALALRDQRSYNGEEIIIERPGGERLTALAHANPILDEAGAVTGALNVLIDVTDRARAVEAQARLAAIVESSNDAIIGKTLDGGIVSWNAAAQQLFGYTAEEAVGRSILLIVPPEREQEEAEILARVARGERIEHFETVRVTKDGRRLDISLSISPIHDASGRVVGASKVARDITGQKRVEEALREADRIKDEFLAMLAHELRNPLAPIRNAVHYLSLKTPHTEDTQWAWEVIDRQMKQIVRLLDDLLDISRITRKKLTLRRERVELGDIVRSAAEASRPLIEVGGQALHVRVDEPVHLNADPARLVQAVSNLLNNSAKYTPRGGEIWVTASRDGIEAVVSVRDTGMGIAPHMLGVIFDMFVQGDRTLERSQGGLGIGLTLVKQIAEMHGGSVVARSQGAGTGAEFTLRIPGVIAAAPSEAAARPPRASGPIERHRVLIVDDNQDSAESLGLLLSHVGHEVRIALDGEDALLAAESLHPDVVVLDIGLPRMNGYDVAQALRRKPWARDLVIIALTGWGQEHDRQRAVEAGFDHHLVKPVDAASLLKLLAFDSRP